MNILRLLAARWLSSILQHPDPPRYPGRLARVLDIIAAGQPIRSRYQVLIEPDLADKTNYLIASARNREAVDEVLAGLCTGDAFIDVGANCGLFSILASQKVGPDGIVIAFEPQAQMAERLRRNLRHNNCHNVLVFELALSDRNEAIAVSGRGDRHTGSAYMRRNYQAGIWALRFDDIMPALSDLIGTRSSSVKIDVEGAELLVLRGMHGWLASAYPKQLTVEIDNKHLTRFNTQAEALYEELAYHGYNWKLGLKQANSDHFDETFFRGVGA